MDVSVLIVNWNTCKILQDCLESVYRETRQISFEVIVVDNASSDDSVAMLQQRFPQVRLIINAENRGFATANNQAMAVAKGRYMLLLNSDTVVLDGAIQKTVAFADQQPEAAVVGCRTLNPDRTLQETCFMFPSLINLFLSATYLYKLFPRHRFFGREQMTWWDRNDERSVEVVTGCYMLVRRQAIEQVGMMDDGFFMYAEETDWCYRFKQAGWKCLFTPAAQIIHLGGASSRKIRPEMIIQLRLSILKFMKKHRGFWTYQLSGGCLLGWFMIRVPYWLLKGLFAGKGRKEANVIAGTYWRGAKRVIGTLMNREKVVCE